MGEGTAGGGASGNHNDGDPNGDRNNGGHSDDAADDRGEPSRQARKQQAADAKRQAGLQAERRKQAEKLEKKLRKDRRRTRLRRGLRLAAGWSAAAIVLAGVGFYAYTRHGNSTGAGGPNDTQSITNGAVPPTPVAQTAGPSSNPFSGTPAATWADGAAGIVVPAAKPVGRYSASQVEDAYQTTKKLLVAAALDPRTLDGGAPAAFTSQLTPQQRTQFVSGLNKVGTDKQGIALSTRAYLISFAPGTTKLIGSVIKVHGTMTARPGKDSGGQAILEVDVNYRMVYAVEPPKAPADWMRVVGQFNGSVLFGDWTEASTPFDPWWDVSIGKAGGRCGVKDGFVHPDFPSGPADTTPAHGKAVNPYSLGDNPAAGCGETTGT